VLFSEQAHDPPRLPSSPCSCCSLDPTHLALLHLSDIPPCSVLGLFCCPVLVQSRQPDARLPRVCASGCSGLPPNSTGRGRSAGATPPKGQKADAESACSASQMQCTRARMKVCDPLRMRVSSGGAAFSWFYFLEVKMSELKLACQDILVRLGG